MKCYYHPQKDAISQCSDCGKGLCEECATKWKPPTCDDCMKNYVNNEMSSVNGELMIYIGLAIAGIIFGCIVGSTHSRNFSEVIFLSFGYAFCFPVYFAGWKWLNKITDYFIFFGGIKFWVIYIFIKLLCSAFVGLVALPYRLFTIFKRKKELNSLIENLK